MLALVGFSGNMKWLIVLLFLVSVSYAQDSSGSQDEDGSGADLDDQLNTALNITDRQNFVFNSSFVLSSSSCITPDGEKGSCKAVSRCPKYLERASQLGTDENIVFFRERICRLLHRTVHVCCPSEVDPANEADSTQSQPLPDTQLGTRQRPQTQPQPQPTTQTQPEQPEQRTRPDSQTQPEEQPEGKEQPEQPEQPKPQSSSQTDPEQETQTQNSSTSQRQPEQRQQPQTQNSSTSQRQPEQRQQPSATQPPTQTVPQPQNTSLIPTEDQCGLPIGASRLPGEEVEPGNWPWLAVIGRRRGSSNFVPICTGTLITRRHVVTAAHCLEETTVDVVKLGEHHLDNNDAGEKPQEYSIANRRVHDFNSTTFENDIAILSLDRDVVFNDFIQPACLPLNFTNNEFVGDSLTLVAWQTTDLDNPETSTIPLETNAPVVEMSQCTEEYQNLTQSMPIDSRQLCASTEGLDTCIGESGGPLNYLNPENGKYYLVGVASFESQCPSSDLPGVFTRVSSFLDWIQVTIQESSRS